MGVMDAVMASMGPSDVFDRACAFVEWVEDMVQEKDIPVELHTGQGAELAAGLFGGEVQGVTVHTHDVKAILLEELAGAREKIREAECTAIKILSEI